MKPPEYDVDGDSVFFTHGDDKDEADRIARIIAALEKGGGQPGPSDGHVPEPPRRET